MVKGWVVYQGQDFVEVTGKHEEFIGPGKARGLFENFVIQNFAEHAKSYDEFNGITDLPSTYLSLWIGWAIMEAKRYGLPPSYPKRLLFLEEEVKRVTGAKKWIGE